ncbi:MAG TPA: VWA domain-containing protein [Vicinamibacterales bacterium]|nr:VWA domain-containing protein [Vicinamibacterales bacterium]
MKITALALALLFLPALPARPALPAVPGLPAFPALQPPTFHTTSSELVVLPVVVTDKHGGYVTDLPRDSFGVYDNGRKVDVQLFSNEDTPVTVGLIVDASSSMARKIGEVIAATLAFAKSSNPDDELFVIRFNDDVKDVMGDSTTLHAADVEALQQVLMSIHPAGRTALYDALMEGFERLDRSERGRKVLILISDGGDNASVATADRVLERARKSNAAIYTIGIFDDMDPDRNPRLLKSLAETTGGERFLPKSAGPLLAACQRIAREIRAGYTIGYAPPDHDGFFHRVRVTVPPIDGHTLSVRTRPGYFADAHDQ